MHFDKILITFLLEVGFEVCIWSSKGGLKEIEIKISEKSLMSYERNVHLKIPIRTHDISNIWLHLSYLEKRNKGEKFISMHLVRNLEGKVRKGIDGGTVLRRFTVL